MKTHDSVWPLVLLLAACGGEDAAQTSSTGNGGDPTATSAGGTANVGGAGGASATGAGGVGPGSGGSGGSPASCRDAGAPTGSMSGSIDVANETRTYELSVPASYDPNAPLPLVFAFHGAGGDGALAKLYFGVEGASNGGAIFVYPDGQIVNTGSTGWDLTTGGKDVAFFDALLAHVSSAYCVDDTRIFSTGHSFGGYFSNTLGCARADVLRAIAPVAGGGPFGGGCTGSVAAWVTHGANDNVVALTQGEGSRDHWQAENGCGDTTSAVTPAPCEAYDGCGAALHWCQHGGGHEWPNFAADGIWDFFASMP